MKRREVIQSVGYSLGAAGMIPFVPRLNLEQEPAVDDSEMRQGLAAEAIASAMNSGADYADVCVRHLHTIQTNIKSVSVNRSEKIYTGIRVLKGAAWGYASTTGYDSAEMRRIGIEATAQAKVGTKMAGDLFKLYEPPVVNGENWTMPVEIDPFSITEVDLIAAFNGVMSYASNVARQKIRGGENFSFKGNADLVKHSTSFRNSNSSNYNQTVFRTGLRGEVTLYYRGLSLGAAMDMFTPAGLGLEYVLNSGVRDQIHERIDSFYQDLLLPVKPVEVGRYDVLLSGLAVAQLLSGTVGAASELDRCLGIEANSTGTSYLNEPAEMAGTHQIGSNLLNVLADRTIAGSVDRVKWDDEGSPAVAQTLVEKGLLKNFIVDRERATWLTENSVSKVKSVPGGHVKLGEKMSSLFSSDGGFLSPSINTPTLVVESDTTGPTLRDMRVEMDKGIEYTLYRADTDFQCLNGLGIGAAYEVKGGKRVGRLHGAAHIYRAPELWKSLSHVGGKSEQNRFGLAKFRGEEGKLTYHSVYTPGMVFKEQSIMNVLQFRGRAEL